MFYEQNNTNRPMIVVVNQNHIQHGGWYGYYYNDMDVAAQLFFCCFYRTHLSRFFVLDDRMDSLHSSENHHGHSALCRSPKKTSSRCLSSNLPRCPLGDASELWRLLTLLLVARFFARPGLFILYLDDTVFHRSGRKVQGASWHRDAVRSTGTKIVYAWGLKLVVLTICVKAPWGGEPLGLPINMRLFRKGKSNLIDLAEEMLREVVQWLPQREFIACGDGFYATLVGRATRRMEIISRIRRDAKIFALPSKKPKHKRGPHPKKGRRLANPQKMATRFTSWKTVHTDERGKDRRRQVYARKVIWYEVSHQPVLLTISRDPEEIEEDDFFVCSNVERSATNVVNIFSGRWCIEDTFKNTKQYLGAEEPQTWKGQGPERAAMLGFWLYSLVWLWFLRQKKNQQRLPKIPWYPHKPYPSFQDALACLRCVLWKERIKVLFAKTSVHDKVFQFLIEALASAA